MRIRALLAVTVAFALLVGCGGGGGGGSSVPSGGGTPAPLSTAIGTTPVSVSVLSGATMSLVTTSGTANVTIATSGSAPGIPVVQGIRPQSATAQVYITLTSASNVTIDYPTFTSSTASGVAFYQNGAWNYTLYTGSNGTFTAPGTLTLTANVAVYFALYTGTPNSLTAFTCPTSDSPTSTGSRGAAGEVHKMLRRAQRTSPASSTIAVVYDRATYERATQSFVQSEQSSGGTLTRTFDYPAIGKVVHVLSVPAAKSAAIISALRAQAGVLTVAATGRRYPTTVTTPLPSAYWPNDPYFNGFPSPLPTPATGGTAPPATYHVGPYEENSSVPGQWDMHAIGLENAFAYLSPNSNTGHVSSPNAEGSSTISIAIIDTGVDTGLAEMSGKVTRQRCFITSADGSTQSTSNIVTDPDGHGTDVAGIAAADLNNSLGFAGAGGNTTIWAYRVFPTPDNNCSSPGTTDPQCGAATADIAAAIDDAVANHANIISMSLGGQPCSSPGNDSDPVEGTAVANAISQNVIVVAASGNESSSSVDSPGCDAGVIAVGATSLDDGQTNGTQSFFGGSPTTPVEYVASYSNYGSPSNNLHSASAWGIVAPGGDPSGSTDNDDLHWIENIWTSTPFDPSTDAGNCNGDYPAETGTSDCRILIAGTSMATPHVAGVAALVLAVSNDSPTYQSPSGMKNFLCSTADDLNAQAGESNSPGANQGCGRVNAYRAIATVLGDSPP